MNLVKTSLRFSFSKRNAQRTTSLMILFGIAISMAAILIIGSAVEALQSKQIDTLRAIESFDLIVDGDINNDQLLSIEGVDSCFDFVETFAILSDDLSNSSIRIRSLDFDSFCNNQRTNEQISVFPFAEKLTGFIPSTSIYTRQNLSNNSSVSLTFLKKGKTATLVPVKHSFEISSCYYCQEPSFIDTTCFIDLSSYEEFFEPVDKKTGLYVSGNLSKIKKAILEIDPDCELTDWKEYNKATYSALMLEKTLIYIFMCFMFLILCTGLKNSTSRMINNRRKDGALLKAIGMTNKDIYNLFIIQGIFLVLFGLVTGALIGLVVIGNIGKIMSFMGFGSYSLDSVLLSMKFSPVIAVLISFFVLLLAFVYVKRACNVLYKKEIMEVFSDGSY